MTVTYSFVYLILFYDLYLTVTNPFSPAAKRLKYYYIVTVVVFLATLAIELVQDLTYFVSSTALFRATVVCEVLPIVVSTFFFVLTIIKLNRQGTNQKLRRRIRWNYGCLFIIQMLLLVFKGFNYHVIMMPIESDYENK